MFSLKIINALNDPDNPAKVKGLNVKLYKSTHGGYPTPKSKDKGKLEKVEYTVDKCCVNWAEDEHECDIRY